MHASDDLAEADRLMVICNSCRYCEGLCAVFPAMELRRTFADGDLTYLANLCHSCGACYTDCQFSPPHEFAVNVPRTLARVRAGSYADHAWPAALQPMFARNGLAIALACALSMAAFILGFALWHAPAALFSTDGAFYALMPHGAMVALFGAAFLYALLALVMGVRSFWRATGGTPTADPAGGLWQAVRDAASLRYLDGGGVGCVNADEKPDDDRRIFHHFVFYGFLLCFAATSVATLYHYVFDWPAPYAWHTLPKLLGIPGGLGLLIGAGGLYRARRRRDPALVDADSAGMDVAFLAMLALTGGTGLLLMVLRQTPAMGLTLAVHLGAVFALFLTLPYGKFVHGLYRFAALVRHAMERRAAERG